MEQPRIITTNDGSHSLYRADLDETYHSHHGAVQESQYVFIKQGLDYWLSKNSEANRLQVLEIGFGTGLNALLALQWAREKNLPLRFTTLEPYPINMEVARELNYGKQLGAEDDMLRLHEAAWGQDELLYDYFMIRKEQQKLEDYDVEYDLYDLIFFDAFAPSKQAEMWEPAMLKKCAEGLAPGGVLTTYCAKGQLKRDLAAVGLQVETLPGAPGKKEMVRAVKN